jgi:FKBP-type peptidyl-prolyl cis-trans isomerase
MKSSALELTVAVCLALASACGEDAKDAAGEEASSVYPALRAPSENAAGESAAGATASSPVTIDKGDGCTVVIQAAGRGRAASIGDLVTLDYLARVSDSEIPFASTSRWTEPCTIELGNEHGPRVVPGLIRGLQGLKPGSKATITIPPALGYGKAGVPSAGIPPDATLVFEVQVSGVRR